MRSSGHGTAAPRGSALLLVPAASIAVHQARYWLAYGSRANAELAAQGHSYLHSLVPWSILALTVAGGSFLRRAALAMRTSADAPVGRLPAGALWLATWAGLVAIYATQETLEASIATGHPGGWVGVFGHGGWWAVPAAAVIAALVTALLLLGRAILRAAGASRRLTFGAPATVLVPVGLARAVLRPLAHAAAGRAPPLRLLPR